jgi:single-strand DNA-binding protein
MQMLTIAGNVGNVKDLKEVSGEKVLNFSIAVDNGKDKSGEKREATWYDCALWGKRAESLAPYIAKGSKLVVSGRPGARAYEGKAYLTLTVGELTFMSSKSDAGSERETEKPAGPRESYDLNDDIPF